MPSSAAPRYLLGDAGIHRLIQGRAGWFLYNRHDVYIGGALECYGEYGQIEADLLAQLVRPGDVAIEVGANIGSLTVGLAKAVGSSGRVIAFEPQRVVFQTLCANVALNSLTWVDTVHAAVGLRPGNVMIAEPDYAKPGNFGGVEVIAPRANTASLPDKAEPVTLLTLDDFYRGDHLRLIKVDVEGMEQDVLEGASRLLSDLRPMLYVENDRRDQSAALIRTIECFGYVCYWHLPFLYNPDNWFGESENLYPGTVSVNMLCLPDEMPSNISGLVPADDPDFHPLAHLQK